MLCVVSVCMATTSSERVCVCVCVCPDSCRPQVGHTRAFVRDIKARNDRDGGRIKQMRAAALPLCVYMCVCARVSVIHLCRGLEAGHRNAMGR